VVSDVVWNIAILIKSIAYRIYMQIADNCKVTKKSRDDCEVPDAGIISFSV